MEVRELVHGKAEHVIKIVCNMCGRGKLTHADIWEDLDPTKIVRKIEQPNRPSHSISTGCVIKQIDIVDYRISGYACERSVDLCDKCTHKMFDWIEKSGGAVTIKITEW